MTSGAAGMDLYAAVIEDLRLEPGGIALVPTGFEVAIPEGFEGQVRPRSGLAVKHGISLRIAQLVVAPVVRVTWNEVPVLEATDRGGKGFGHSGV